MPHTSAHALLCVRLKTARSCEVFVLELETGVTEVVGEILGHVKILFILIQCFAYFLN